MFEKNEKKLSMEATSRACLDEWLHDSPHVGSASACVTFGIKPTFLFSNVRRPSDGREASDPAVRVACVPRQDKT
jgi:hypothetical protein